MQTKLTLNLEDELIQQIEAYAKQQNKSISQIITEYFQHLTQQTKNVSVPPITRSLIGVLQDHKVDSADYKQYLQDKYL